MIPCKNDIQGEEYGHGHSGDPGRYYMVGIMSFAFATTLGGDKQDQE